MKKKVVLWTGLFLFLLGISFNFSSSGINESSLIDISILNSASAQGENPLCPNGCIDNGSGCFCHYWFDDYEEYDWG